MCERGYPPLWRPALRAQVANAGVAVRFTQLLRRRLHHERMMQKRRRLRSSEKPREQYLSTRGLEQVFSTDDEVDALNPVVDRHGELIGPVAISIAHQQVAALRAGLLRLRTQA